MLYVRLVYVIVYMYVLVNMYAYMYVNNCVFIKRYAIAVCCIYMVLVWFHFFFFIFCFTKMFTYNTYTFVPTFLEYRITFITAIKILICTAVCCQTCNTNCCRYGFVFWQLTWPYTCIHCTRVVTTPGIIFVLSYFVCLFLRIRIFFFFLLMYICICVVCGMFCILYIIYIFKICWVLWFYCALYTKPLWWWGGVCFNCNIYFFVYSLPVSSKWYCPFVAHFAHYAAYAAAPVALWRGTSLPHWYCLWRMSQTARCPFGAQSAAHPRWWPLYDRDHHFCYPLQT